MSKRNEGIGEEIGGKIKAGVGKLVGNEEMQAEGKAHELHGKAKQEAAKAAERTKGKVQEAAGASDRAASLSRRARRAGIRSAADFCELFRAPSRRP